MPTAQKKKTTKKKSSNTIDSLEHQLRAKDEVNDSLRNENLRLARRVREAETEAQIMREMLAEVREEACGRVPAFAHATTLDHIFRLMRDDEAMKTAVARRIKDPNVTLVNAANPRKTREEQEQEWRDRGRPA